MVYLSSMRVVTNCGSVMAIISMRSNHLLKPTPGRSGGAARLWLVAGAA
jgi:hypothetical protein